LIKTKISYRLDNPIQKYDFSNRSKELSKLSLKRYIGTEKVFGVKDFWVYR